MPSPIKAIANQRNAQRSMGSRTDAGKTRSCINALKHGLAVSALPELAHEVTVLAQRIAGYAADRPDVLQAAARAAEAAIDVLRARRARVELMNRMSRDPDFLEFSSPDASQPVRPERPLSSSAPAGPASPEGAPPQFGGKDLAGVIQWNEFMDAQHAAQQHRAKAKQRAFEWKQLGRLDRYERRALSRRNTAIRDFDAIVTAATKTRPTHIP